MAMTSAPFGLTPVRYLNGAPWNNQMTLYYIASTDTNAYAFGDPVTLSGDGSALGVPGVTLATAGTSNVVTGVIVTTGAIVEGGAFVNPANLDTTVIPATKSVDYFVGVVDDPNVIFAIQESNDSTAFTSANIGENANLASGTNNGYVSGWALAETGVATTNTLQLKLLGLQRTQGNIFGHFAIWHVLINNHSYRSGITGV
ncbi:MAG: hypothetical protein ACYDB1_00825 [Acidiferrobacteraceae bacterium]